MSVTVFQLWNQSGNLDHTIQASKYVTKFPGDLSYPAANSDKDLPKSLFYEYTESQDGTPSGLFNYYLLGNRIKVPNPNAVSDANTAKFTYKGSEKFGANNAISTDESRNPTAFNIIKTTTISEAYLDPASDFIGQPYNPKDFIFCKNYGIIPNNRMITLRRFPSPVFDNLKIPVKSTYPSRSNGETIAKEFTGFTKQDVAKGHINIPVAQAVTYFGEGTDNNLSGILGFSTGLNWGAKDQQELQNVTENDPGLYEGFSDLFNSFFKKGDTIDNIFKTADKVGGTVLNQEKMEKQFARKLYDGLLHKKNGPLSERIFVDINTVNRMYVRKVGLTGGMDPITLTFKYDLTSASDINSKILFLDLLANLLAIGTDYGRFLTPQILEDPKSIGFSFPGGADGYKKYLTDPLLWAIDMMQNNHAPEVRAKVKDLDNQLKDIQNGLKQFRKTQQIDKGGKLYRALTLMLTENMLDKLVFEPLMLTGYPTGNWHMVVGNPLNPIATIGNLICREVKISFNQVLGPDDFPTEMTAVYRLDHARQRHRGEFESMFNRGQGRLYLGEFPVTQATTGQVTVSTGNNPDQFDVTNLQQSSANAGAGQIFPKQ